MIASPVPKSLRRAINHKCKECIYDPRPGNGTWRQQVAACTSNSCALFNVRPRPISHAKPASVALELSELDEFDLIPNAEDGLRQERKL